MSSEMSETVASPDLSSFSPTLDLNDELTHEQTDALDYNREALIKKLQDMPMETLKAIITNQIDLEIRLKHKELSLTEKEIGRCESQMITLRKFFKIPSNVNFDNEPNGFTHKYSNLLSQALNFNYENLSKLSSLSELLGPGALLGTGVAGDGNRILYSDASSVSSWGGAGCNQGDGLGSRDLSSGPGSFGPDEGETPTHSYRTRSTTSSLRPSSSVSSRRQTYGCLYRRTDGIIVKLTCSTCLRSNFSSAQGFLNHNRIAHSKEFTSQDAAALQCGEILPTEEQDEEGILSLQNLKLKGLDPKNNLNVNEVFFNGLTSSLNYVKAEGQAQSQNPVQLQAANHNQGQSQNQNQNQNHEQLTSKPIASPRRKSNDQLMKKLIAKGITSDKKDYDRLIHDTMSEVKNSHLFNEEEEDEDEVEANNNTNDNNDDDTNNNTNNNTNNESSNNDADNEGRKDKMRRTSRGGVGISKPGTFSSKNNKNVSTSTGSIGSGLPKLKLKIKRSSESL